LEEVIQANQLKNAELTNQTCVSEKKTKAVGKKVKKAEENAQMAKNQVNCCTKP
jgi:hypothetical protein